MRIILFALLVLLSSCSLHHEDAVFEHIDLRSEIIDIKSADLIDPVEVIIFDSLLIIKNSPVSSYMFTIADVKNDVVIKHFGTEGRGPREQLSSFLFEKSRIDRCFDTYNLQLLQYQRINIDSALQKDNFFYEPVAEFKQTGDDINDHNFSHPVIMKAINDSIYIAMDFYDNHIFGLYKEGQLVGTYLEYPGETYDANLNKMKLELYQGEIKVNSDEQLFAFTAHYSDWLIIGKVVEDSIRKVHSNYSYLPDYVVEGGRYFSTSRNSKLGHFNLQVCSSFIFTQESSKTINESLRGTRISKTSDVIKVYDWSGTPKYKLCLDHKVTAYAINEQEKLLYAIATIPEPIILKYSLRKIYE